MQRTLKEPERRDFIHRATTAVVRPAKSAIVVTPRRHSHPTNRAAPLAGPASVSPCDQTSLQNLINGGGTIGFGADCHLNLNATLTVPAGDTVTIDGTGHSVIIDGLDQGTGNKAQVLNVRGNLTLENLTVTNGQAVGADGSQGSDGNSPTAASASGGDAGSGSPGAAGQGGGLFITSGAAATVKNVTFSDDNAAGGIGGPGGLGGAGNCDQTPFDNGFSCNFPNGGPSGSGGRGGAGAVGGVGQGGAIYNAGSLAVATSTFNSDVASGGSGGDGGPGGSSPFSACFLGCLGVPPGVGGPGGNAGGGGNAQGGAIYSSGTLQVQNSSFSSDGAAAGLGGDANNAEGYLNPNYPFNPCAFGGFGSELSGGCGGDSITGGTGGDGGKGGNGGKGGSAAGGAIWSTKNKATLSGVSFSGDTVAAGQAPPEDCTISPATLGCGGLGGPGGNNYSGAPGAPGQSGADGMKGGSGTAVNPDVYSSSSKALTIKTKSLSKATIDKAYEKTLSASGGSAPYTWTVLGLPAGMGSSDGVIGGTPVVAGTFPVTISVTDPTDPSPTTISTLLSLTVKGVKPKITLQPTSVTASSGATVSFSAAASGEPTPTVQWEISVSHGPYVPIPGATTTTLVLHNVTASESGDKYKALFTNAAGSKGSKGASLKVAVP